MIDPDDERTQVSPRRRAQHPAPASVPAHEDPQPVVGARRTGDAGQAPATGEADDATVIVRRSPLAPAPDLDRTAISARAAGVADAGMPTLASTASGPAGPRRGGLSIADESTIDDDGATSLARGTARHRALAAAATDATGRVTAPDGGGTPAPRARVAHAPADAAQYAVRSVPATSVARAEPVRSAPQAPVDTAAADAALRRRRRRRAVAVVVAAAVVVLVATVALVVLLTAG